MCVWSCRGLPSRQDFECQDFGGVRVLLLQLLTFEGNKLPNEMVILNPKFRMELTETQQNNKGKEISDAHSD